MVNSREKSTRQDSALFANINAYKTFVQRGKDDVKEFSRIAANTARTFDIIYIVAMMTD
jgi:hypothetical protein